MSNTANYNALLTLTTNLLNGYQLSDADFQQYLQIAQAKYEGMRNWQIMKAPPVSLGVINGNYLTSYLLASDFKEPDDDNPIVLLDSAQNEFVVYEVPIAFRNRYKDVFGRYYIDYTQNLIYFCGIVNSQYTGLVNYIKEPPLVTNTQDWIFPKKFMPILAYDVAVNYKGIDYDIVNTTQAQYNKEQLQELLEQMVTWDNNLMERSLRGLDRSVDNGGGVFISGTIDMNK